jgi:hypothetical protein
MHTQHACIQHTHTSRLYMLTPSSSVTKGCDQRVTPGHTLVLLYPQSTHLQHDSCSQMEKLLMILQGCRQHSSTSRCICCGTDLTAEAAAAYACAANALHAYSCRHDWWPVFAHSPLQNTPAAALFHLLMGHCCCHNHCSSARAATAKLLQPRCSCLRHQAATPTTATPLQLPATPSCHNQCSCL